MSTNNSLQPTVSSKSTPINLSHTFDCFEEPQKPFDVREAVAKVADRIAPVWPLKDYVAVNPYYGFSEQEFLQARHQLRLLSDIETLMPVDYYRQQFAAGTLTRSDIAAAVDELVSDGVEGAERIDVNQVVGLLQESAPTGPTADAEFQKATSIGRPLRAYAESVDRYTGSHWTRLIMEEISRHCSSHYDVGQAIWSDPFSALPLYQSWHSSARYDRNFELLGVEDFRAVVAEFPHDPIAAIGFALGKLNVPAHFWARYLLCEALAMPGWSAFAQYHDLKSEREGREGLDFAGLLAMRLIYNVALCRQTAFEIDWTSVATQFDCELKRSPQPSDEEIQRYALLRASEIAYRGQLLTDVLPSAGDDDGLGLGTRGLAQMVFCIDVRSERIRRSIESASPQVETFGFAGFFGLPIEYVELGETSGSSQVPVLISPAIKVYEATNHECDFSQHHALQNKADKKTLSSAWKLFQSSAASCFAFVETAGLFYGGKLFARLFGSRLRSARSSNVSDSKTAPSLLGLAEQGFDASRQADTAASILRGIGIVENFAKLVVLCGHGSQVDNNPLKAGLDCGACGGHSGEPNARFAARLLNQPHVRAALADRGIDIPADTLFLSAVHNTTTDEISFFDLGELPQSHLKELEALQAISSQASRKTRTERLTTLPGSSDADLFRRSADWSEVRPEWGLAGNAAFIAAPRKMTRSMSLSGRSFLHSYDCQLDPNFQVLEQIMTAPLVVANWINMQYYASTVDPVHFGSGNKTVHNVVGRFGVMSGNSGDLMTGLPWQSVHDGKLYQHHPMRLLAVVAAPRQAVESILERHEKVAQLILNGWVQLVVIEGEKRYRLTERQVWEDV